MDVQDFLVQGEGHEEDKREAWQLFQQAYERQMKGELEEAVTLYKKSIETHPTAAAFSVIQSTQRTSKVRRIDITPCGLAG